MNQPDPTNQENEAVTMSKEKLEQFARQIADVCFVLGLCSMTNQIGHSIMNVSLANQPPEETQKEVKKILEDSTFLFLQTSRTYLENAKNGDQKVSAFLSRQIQEYAATKSVMFNKHVSENIPAEIENLITQ